VKSRLFLPVVAALILAGCSSQANLWSQYFQVLREGWRNSTGQGTVTIEQAAAIPYATLAYRLNGSSERLLVLATNTNGDLLWTAASRVVMQTRDGRVQRTVGLPRDRGSLSAAPSAPIPAPGQALRASYRSVKFADFPDAGLYGVQINCLTKAGGREMINILGTAISTTRVDESCESNTPRWRFTDSYWVDAESGFVWLSLQHLHPAGGTLQIRILRPPE
jgi:hypothetical protein